MISRTRPFSADRSNGVLRFEYGIPKVRTFENFMTFIDPERGTFNEVEYKGSDRYSRLRPYTVNGRYRSSLNITDREEEPVIVEGMVSSQLAAFIVHHKNDTHFQIFQKMRYFHMISLQKNFEMSNELQNMDNQKKLNLTF